MLQMTDKINFDDVITVENFKIAWKQLKETFSKDLVKDPIVIKTNSDKDLAKYYLSIKYNYGLDDIRSKLVKYIKSNITIDSNLINSIVDDLIVEYEDIEEYIEL